MAEPGAGVDSKGQPVLDPTKNVLDLVDAAMRRQDDLRIAEFKRQDDLRVKDAEHVRELLTVRAEFAAELRKLETDRLDAIRSVDQSQVQRAAEVQATQAGALASQVVATADAFRAGLTAALEPIIKDIADLRKTQYEQAGQRAQVGETRLNLGAVLGGVSVLLVLIFGMASLYIASKP